MNPAPPTAPPALQPYAPHGLWQFAVGVSVPWCALVVALLVGVVSPTIGVVAWLLIMLGAAVWDREARWRYFAWGTVVGTVLIVLGFMWIMSMYVHDARANRERRLAAQAATAAPGSATIPPQHRPLPPTSIAEAP